MVVDSPLGGSWLYLYLCLPLTTNIFLISRLSVIYDVFVNYQRKANEVYARFSVRNLDVLMNAAVSL